MTLATSVSSSQNYVEQFLQLSDGSDNKRCVVLNGQLTGFLRARWADKRYVTKAIGFSCPGCSSRGGV